MPAREPRAGRVRFAGYAAVFDLPDRGGDIVKAGAFKRSLTSDRAIRLLWQHRAGSVIGKIERIEEDGRGLRVIASLNGSETGSTAARMIGARQIDGLSFGYRVRAAEQMGRTRVLTDVDLLEVSVVARPMQPRARIHAVHTG